MKKIMILISTLLLALIGFICIFLYIQNNQIPTLGYTNGQLSELPSTPNAISSQTKDQSRKVRPLPFKSTETQTIHALLHAIQLHGNVSIITQQPNYLYAVFTSNLFKFKDDVEFLLDTKTQMIHIRSASRAGKSDLGVNKKRYEAIAKFYHQAN